MTVAIGSFLSGGRVLGGVRAGGQGDVVDETGGAETDRGDEQGARPESGLRLKRVCVDDGEVVQIEARRGRGRRAAWGGDVFRRVGRVGRHQQRGGGRDDDVLGRGGRRARGGLAGKKGPVEVRRHGALLRRGAEPLR